MNNQVFRNWVPKPVAIIFLMILFVPLMSMGTVYSACAGDTIGALQIWTEDFTFASLCAMIGMASAAPFFYKIACRRRHRTMFLAGFAVLIVLSACAQRAADPVLLGLISLAMGVVRFTLIVVNFATFARLLLGVDFRQMLGPQGDADTEEGWDKTENGKSAMVPIANVFFMSVGQLGTWITAYYAYNYHWQEVYSLIMVLLTFLAIVVVILEKPRGWTSLDESASSEEDLPELTYNNRPFNLRHFANCTAVCVTWCAAAFVLVYGKTLDWFNSYKIWVACAVFVVGLVSNILIDIRLNERHRYFRYEIWKYRNVRLATVVYCIAMIVNSSSSLTSVVSQIGLKTDTYINNMLGNWSIVGFVLAALTIIILRKKGVEYKYIFALGFLGFAYTMWFTYNQVQYDVYYGDIRFLSIVRNYSMFILYSISMIYAYQRLPYRLMPSWIHIMIISRSVMGPAIGSGLFGSGLQYYQQYFINSLSYSSDNIRMVNIQSMMLAVKQMSGYTIWFCLIMAALLVMITWKKRKLTDFETRGEKC